MRMPSFALAVPLLLAASLARAGDPVPAAPRTPEEVAARVRELLDSGYSSRCSTGYDEEIAKLGRPAVAPLLEGLRSLEPGHTGDSLSCSALRILAEKEDVPALRDLLLAGRVNVASALEKLQGKGVPEATNALLDAVAAGGMDRDILRILAKAPDRERVVKAVRERIGDGKGIPEGDRAAPAELFGALRVRDALPILREWAATSRTPGPLVAVADALVLLGDRKGVEVLVHVAGERRTRFPCRASTPEEEKAASSPGRLCPGGFDDSDRERAVERLGTIAGKGVYDLAEYWRRDLPRRGPEARSPDDVLDDAAAAFRKWWEASGERLRYDAEKGRWVVGP
jgi:DNA-binding Lrp family transcriptional regulator